MNSFDITTDSELKTAVRADTQYDDSEDELSDTDLETLINRAKQRLYLQTDSTEWYSDSGLGLALFGYACMRVKSAMENIPLDSYSLGDEDVSFDTDDVDDSLQMQMWAEDVSTGLDASTVDATNARLPQNSADYIGEDYIHDDEHDEWGRESGHY